MAIREKRCRICAGEGGMRVCVCCVYIYTRQFCLRKNTNLENLIYAMGEENIWRERERREKVGEIRKWLEIEVENGKD